MIIQNVLNKNVLSAFTLNVMFCVRVFCRQTRVHTPDDIHQRKNYSGIVIDARLFLALRDHFLERMNQ